jgi:hypothetical protein
LDSDALYVLLAAIFRVASRDAKIGRAEARRWLAEVEAKAERSALGIITEGAVRKRSVAGSALAEIEEGGDYLAAAEVEREGPAAAGPALLGLPVELVGAVAQVLQARGTAGVLLYAVTLFCVVMGLPLASVRRHFSAIVRPALAKLTAGALSTGAEKPLN